MISQAKRGLIALVLCAACADTESDQDSDLGQGTPGADTGVAASPDAGGVPPTSINTTTNPVVSVVDAGANPTNPINPTNPVNPVLPGFPRRDGGGIGLPSADAGMDTPPVSTPGTVCSGSYTGMAGSTADLKLNGRDYTLHIGRNVKPNEASPLVFSLHGLSMTPRSMEAMAGWDAVADKEGLIIARPAGVGASNAWDTSGPTDFDLMKAIIEDVNAKACVDRKRIFATGFSMGGLMSFAMACKQGDIIAATAPTSGQGSAARGCVARAVPVYAWHGDADGVVNYSGSKNGIASWVTHNKCTGTPVDSKIGSANCQEWNMCSAGSAAKLCTVPGGGHTYTRAATQSIWEFFKAHPLP